MLGKDDRPFDLAQDLLLHPRLLKLADNQHLLCMQVHPLVADGWSMNIFLEESLHVYKGLQRSGELHEWHAPPVSYASCVEKREKRYLELMAEADLAFWKQKIGYEPIELYLPTDFHRPQPTAFVTDTIPVAIPAPVQTKLDAFCRQEKASHQQVILTVLNMLLRRYSGEDEIRVGMLVSGRDEPDLERVIGVFANPVVVQTFWQDELTFREALLRVQMAVDEANKHQQLPFAKMVSELSRSSRDSSQPFFRVLLHATTAHVVTDVPGLQIEELDAGYSHERVDLVVKVTDSREGLKCSLTYAADLFQEETIHRMAGHFLTLLDGALADPGAKLCALPILTAAERHQLLVEWD